MILIANFGFSKASFKEVFVYAGSIGCSYGGSFDRMMLLLCFGISLPLI
jgi:hypothetical protein